MNYLLAVLSHGRNERMMRQAIAAWHEHATPAPAEVLIHHDTGRAGFCAATAALWAKAAASEREYVAWLEHDFLLTRPVDLAALASILDANRDLSQVTLMRDAYSFEEKAAGGLFESRQGAERWERREWGYVQGDYVMTTNPSLMRRGFMADHPWPAYPQFCEGRFGLELHARGFRGGVYGDGTPWVTHVGRRDGSGHGY